MSQERNDVVASGQPTGVRGRDRRHERPGRGLRLTPRFHRSELDDIEAAAAAAGMTPTGFCADAVLAAARRLPPAGDPTREGLAVLQSELFAVVVAVNRVGTNLNQAVAALNATGEAPVWLEHAVARCLRSQAGLDELVTRIDRRLR